jgi:hypothetical protein
VTLGRRAAAARYLPPAVLATLLALAGLLAALVPLGTTLAGAAGDRAHAAPTQTPLVPFTGTAITTWIARPSLAPPSAIHDLGANRITTSWSIQDATHFRIDSQVNAPGLDSNENTIVANGKHLIWYSSMANRALRMPLSTTAGLGYFGLFQGPYALPPGTSLQQYLTAFNNKKLGTHAHSAGQAEVLGRTTDVIDVSPVYTESNRNSQPCSSAKSCRKQEHGVGRARLWLDHQYGVILRSRTFGIPSNSSFQRHLHYQVTNITYGQGPTAEQLAYNPPGPIVKPPPNSGSSTGGPWLPSAHWQLPAPFISIGGLKGPDGQKYSVRGVGEAGDPMLGEPAMEEGVFTPGPWSANGPYVYVQERIRADGVPAELRTGQGIQIGPCQVWIGAYPDGLNHLALSRGQIAVLLVSNALSQSDLQRYASKHLCT